jgi:hypothetical protein
VTVLETFFYLFDADARKLEQGLKEADRQNDKLKDDLDKTDEAAKMVGGSLLKMAYGLGAALGGILSVGAITAMTFEVADFVDNMADAADAIGVAVDELHAWELAVVASDGEQGAFTASLNQFNVGLQDIATKGKGRLLPFLKELGLSMKDVEEGSKDPTTALLKMSDTFSKLSKAEAAGLGAKIGLDQGTINLLTKGRQGVEDLIKEQRALGVITKEDAEKAAALDAEMKKWNATWATTKRELAMTLIPSLTWFFDKLRAIVNWMTDHKVAVLTFFGAIAAMLIGVYAPAAITAAAATWALIAPYVAVGAAIAAVAAVIALVADDLYNFMQGNDSVIGEIAKKWPIVGEVIRGVGDALAWLIAFVASFATSFVTLITEGPQAAIKSFNDQIRFLIDDISAKFPIVGDVFNAVTGTMADGIGAVVAIWEWLVAKVSRGIELFMRGVEIVKGLHGAGARLLGFSYAEEPPAPRRTAAASPAPASPAPAPRTPAPAAAARPAATPAPGRPDARTAAAPAAPAPASAAPRRTAAAPGPVAPPAPAPAAPARVPASSRPVAATSPAPERPAAPAAAREPVPAAPRRAVLDTRTAEVIPAETRRPRAVGGSTSEGQATRSAVEAGRQQIAITNSPIVAQSSNSITNATTNRSSTKQTDVKIDRIDVHTQATDGPSVASALSDHLGTQLRGAIDQNDDGVLA